MNSFLSRQTSTNVLLITLIILNLVSLFIFTNTLGKIQKTLNYIGSNTDDTRNNTAKIAEDSKYMQISLEEIARHFGGY